MRAPRADAVAKNRASHRRRAQRHRQLRQRLYCRHPAVAAGGGELSGAAAGSAALLHFGHPDLLLFIQRLSNQVKNLGLGEVLVGDMAMPAGGRFSSGHASHQSGLDADIWLQTPRQRWTASQLLKTQPLDLVSANGRGVVPRLWRPQTAALIKLAAEDNQVTRIFVNPAIKKTAVPGCG